MSTDPVPVRVGTPSPGYQPLFRDNYGEGIPDHLEYNAIKVSTLDALRRYVYEHIPPGGFLTAMLENDLSGALGRADEENRRTIYEIHLLIYNEIPAVCHGSPLLVQKWLNLRKWPAEEMKR